MGAVEYTVAGVSVQVKCEFLLKFFAKLNRKTAMQKFASHFGKLCITIKTLQINII